MTANGTCQLCANLDDPIFAVKKIANTTTVPVVDGGMASGISAGLSLGLSKRK